MQTRIEDGYLNHYTNLYKAAAAAATAAAKSLQSCPTLCDPRDGSPPGSPVPGILQARTLEWVAISFSNAWKWKVKVKSLSRVWLQATPWTAAYQAPLSMGFARQEYWCGVPLPSSYKAARGRQILYITYICNLKKLDSQKQRAEWWLLTPGSEENGEWSVKEYRLLIRWKHSGDLMFSMMAVVNDTVLHT